MGGAAAAFTPNPSAAAIDPLRPPCDLRGYGGQNACPRPKSQKAIFRAAGSCSLARSTTLPAAFGERFGTVCRDIFRW
ncbi:MAG: hypothetical protein WC057_07370 [Dehalococcoidales bacterium]